MSETDERGIVKEIIPKQQDVDPWAELRRRPGVTVRSEARIDA